MLIRMTPAPNSREVKVPDPAYYDAIAEYVPRTGYGSTEAKR